MRSIEILQGLLSGSKSEEYEVSRWLVLVVVSGVKCDIFHRFSSVEPQGDDVDGCSPPCRNISKCSAGAFDGGKALALCRWGK